jgi:hypothetical protein
VKKKETNMNAEAIEKIAGLVADGLELKQVPGNPNASYIFKNGGFEKVEHVAPELSYQVLDPESLVSLVDNDHAKEIGDPESTRIFISEKAISALQRWPSHYTTIEMPLRPHRMYTALQNLTNGKAFSHKDFVGMIRTRFNDFLGVDSRLLETVKTVHASSVATGDSSVEAHSMRMGRDVEAVVRAKHGNNPLPELFTLYVPVFENIEISRLMELDENAEPGSLMTLRFAVRVYLDAEYKDGQAVFTLTANAEDLAVAALAALGAIRGHVEQLLTDAGLAEIPVLLGAPNLK